MPLHEAYEIALYIDDLRFPACGLLVSCVPGRLGFYADRERYENRWILERTEGR